MEILVNRVLNGTHNKSNLGHEIIDFFKADDGKHYIYVVANGVLGEKHNNSIETILITEPCNDTNTVHVIAKATGLEHLAIREKGDDPLDVRNRLENLGLNKKITYDKTQLNKIFSKPEKVAWVTFRADSMLRPKDPMYLTNDSQKADEDTIFVLKKVGSRKQSIFFENKGALADCINDNSKWESTDQFKPVDSRKDPLSQVDETVICPDYKSMVTEFIDRIKKYRVTIVKKASN